MAVIGEARALEDDRLVAAALGAKAREADVATRSPRLEKFSSALPSASSPAW